MDNKPRKPIFLCIANLSSLSVEFYTTGSLLIGVLHKSAKRIVLIPGSESDPYKAPETEDDLSEQRIYLGKPILKILAQELADDETVNKYASILRQWISLDRENIINRFAGMYWIIGPTDYKTNEPIQEPFNPIIVYLWSVNNLEKCKINFGRLATALRVVIRALGTDREKALVPIINDLEQALKSLNECLDPFAKNILREQIGLNIK